MRIQTTVSSRSTALRRHLPSLAGISRTRSTGVAGITVAVLTLGALAGCSASTECGSGAGSAIDAVKELLIAAPSAAEIADLCMYVTGSYAADNADLEALKDLASEAEGSELTYKVGGAMGSAVQVDVATTEGTMIHRFHVEQADDRWAARIDDLAD